MVTLKKVAHKGQPSLSLMFLPHFDVFYYLRDPLQHGQALLFLGTIFSHVLAAIKDSLKTFPFGQQVLMLVAVRKVMEKIFNLHELEVLDDLMPESIKKKQADEAAKKKDDDYDSDEDEYDEDGFNHCDETDGKKVNIS